MLIIKRSPQIALRTPTIEVTFSELAAQLEKLKRQLLANPIANATQAWLLPICSTVDDVLLAIAALQLGRTLVLLHCDLSPNSLNEKMRLLPNSFDLKHSVLVPGNPKIRLHERASLIIFTSGSSGSPKAVQLSRNNIEENTTAVATSLELELVSEQHLFLPLHHAFAFLGHLVPGLVHGLTTHLYTDFSAFLKSGHLRSGAGLLAGVPSHFEAIVRTTLAPQTQLTQIVSAGGHLSPDLRLKLSRIFPQAIISTNYGQTEASPRILSLKSTNLEFFKGSDGFPVGQWQLRIGGTGELQVKGPQVMLGYTDQPQTSEWLSTGDLAELSSDGHFKILGRNDNLIKLGGERVSLPTLETNYKANLGTTELILLTQADLLRGTILHLVLKESDMTNSQALSTLSNWFRKSHLPCKIVRLKEIPYLANGKPDRKFLQDLVTK